MTQQQQQQQQQWGMQGQGGEQPIYDAYGNVIGTMGQQQVYYDAYGNAVPAVASSGMYPQGYQVDAYGNPMGGAAAMANAMDPSISTTVSGSPQDPAAPSGTGTPGKGMGQFAGANGSNMMGAAATANGMNGDASQLSTTQPA